MRWFEPGFLLNQRSNREELMDRPHNTLYWNEKKEKGFTRRKRLFKEAIR